MGSIIKCIATYAVPWWRDSPDSNVSFVFDPEVGEEGKGGGG